MSIYKKENINNKTSFAQIEKSIYGSSRIGIDKTFVEMIAAPPVNTTNYKRVLGNKNYELVNHLGNVLSVVSDRKIAVSANGTTIDYFLADVVSASDYSAFGAPLYGRTFSSEKYRFGFGGMEKDDEVYGAGNYLDFTYRGYNPRLGRFFAVDPITSSYPMLTPYQLASNTPIWARELEGLEAWYTNEGNTTSDEFGSGPQNASSGPLADEHALDLGYTQYGVMENAVDYSFSNQEVTEFSNWNASKCPTESGACLGCAVTGSEMLTGGDAGFRNSNGKNVLAGKTLYDVGTNLENTGNAVELPTQMNQETTTVLNNPNAASTENTTYILGPAGAYHSIIMIHNTAGNTFSIFDQGTGWDVKNATKQGAQSQISDINSVHPTWGSRMWQLNKSTKVESIYPIGQ